MTDEKVYTPATIEDQPLPNTTEPSVLTEGGSTANEVYTPKTIKEIPLPRRVIAHETIGSALNTLSRKILGTFEFIQQGAIQIGKYINGVSGDIRLTPGGITARDQSGNTTFALDGETGNATFKGSVQSGSLITGDVALEEGGQISIGGDPVLDQYGLVSTAGFNVQSINEGGINTSSMPFVDITNAYIDVAKPRPVFALINYSCIVQTNTPDSLVAQVQLTTNNNTALGYTLDIAIPVEGTITVSGSYVYYFETNYASERIKLRGSSPTGVTVHFVAPVINIVFLGI